MLPRLTTLAQQANGFNMEWSELDADQRSAAALWGGTDCSWPPVDRTTWPEWCDLSSELRMAALSLGCSSVGWPPLRPWRTLWQLVDKLSGCGVEAVAQKRGDNPKVIWDSLFYEELTETLTILDVNNPKTPKYMKEMNDLQEKDVR